MSSKLIAGNATNGSSLSADTTGILEIQTGSGPTTAITVDASQNIGIGTSTPFTAAGYHSLTLNGSTAGFLSMQTNGTDAAYIYPDGSAFNIKGVANVPTVFYTNNTERMRIDSSGNVGIGTSSPFGLLTAKGSNGQLTLNNGGSAGGMRISVFNNAGNANGYLAFEGYSSEYGRFDSSGNLLVGGTANPNSGKIASNVANSARFMSFVNNSNSAEIGSIQNNSGTSVLYNVTSDYRLKSNVSLIEDAIQTISKLNPVTYTWIQSNTNDAGFLAHEFQSVIPNYVVGEKDAVNEHGNPIYQQMDSSGVIPFLVKAIQELNAKVTALETQLGAK